MVTINVRFEGSEYRETYPTWQRQLGFTRLMQLKEAGYHSELYIDGREVEDF